MKWNVKSDFCAEGATYSSNAPRVYQFYSKLNIETDVELTKDQKNRIVAALIREACVELIHINEESK